MAGKPRTCTVDGCTDTTVARRLCRKHYQAAMKAGTLDQHAKLPPRVKNPKICPPDHRHGEVGTCYVHHQCRCDDCVTSQTKRNYRRLQLKAYGRYDTGLVDADPVREHLIMLGEFGLGYKRVASIAGLGITPVRNVIWGRQDPGPRKGEMQKRIKRETAEAILSVKPDISLLAGGARIPARGTHRRMQALVARGWSQSKLTDRLGVERSNFGVMMTREHVTADLHRRAERLFEELWDQLPPNEEWRDKIAYTRTVAYAKQRRWLPPLAWDDIDNDVDPPVPDDEEGGLDDMAVELAIAGERVRLTPAERRECVTRLHAARWSDGRIAETIHCDVKTVGRIRDELGLAAFDQTELRQRGAA
ncbi:MAG: hypothetical protein J0I43_01835 [Microbacterium sp.]|uniref:hypothetical protein n=1 Tax=Microbacterium sp. TaxID=51671 RepID=UPI001AC2B3C6|nr:hypothetical protein [Microbacterium sp.]MBN9176099.1 hypothetical protein [Microbacterium sp.]